MWHISKNTDQEALGNGAILTDSLILSMQMASFLCTDNTVFITFMRLSEGEY